MTFTATVCTGTVCARWWHVVGPGAERRRSRLLGAAGHETSMRKRHRYVTVIDGDTGRTLAMVEHRNSAALSAFLMQQGHAR